MAEDGAFLDWGRLKMKFIACSLPRECPGGRWRWRCEEKHSFLAKYDYDRHCIGQHG
jgi:hypothetical protein